MKEEDTLRELTAREIVKMDPNISSQKLADIMGLCRGTLGKIYIRDGLCYLEWKMDIVEEMQWQ